MKVEAQVDELIDTRGGKELLTPAYDDVAHRIDDIVYRSGGTSASYLVLTDHGRLIVNAGMGFESYHHKALFDAVRPGPTSHIIATQAHADHVGGVAHFREPGTVYVAQENNLACQQDERRLLPFRGRYVPIWFDVSGAGMRRLSERYPGVDAVPQDSPIPDLTFATRLGLDVDGLRVELISTPGETIDGSVVWLPEPRIVFIGNLLGPLFPHFPNLNTLRGDKYRMPEDYLGSVRTLRDLRPELLITGRAEPIRGAGLVDACLGRLHDAVDFVHAETIGGINEGKDVWTLMREVQLPPHLRVGEGYGRVAWGVRTIWEIYCGWFKLQSTTEIYPDQRVDALAELVDLAGADLVAARARALLDGGHPVLAIHLVEGVLARAGSHGEAAAVMVDAHRQLLAAGGSDNLWLDGWLRHEVDRHRRG